MYDFSSRTFLLFIPYFVAPSNRKPLPALFFRLNIPQPTNINQQTQNARKHCPFCTPGWASNSRAHSPSKHPHNHPHVDCCLDLDPLRLQPSKQDHNPPILAVWHCFQCQWRHHASTRHQPDQRPACCSSSQTQQSDRRSQVEYNDQAHRLLNHRWHSESDLQVRTREHFRHPSQLFKHQHHYKHQHYLKHKDHHGHQLFPTNLFPHFHAHPRRQSHRD